MAYWKCKKCRKVFKNKNRQNPNKCRWCPSTDFVRMNKKQEKMFTKEGFWNENYKEPYIEELEDESYQLEDESYQLEEEITL